MHTNNNPLPCTKRPAPAGPQGPINRAQAKAGTPCRWRSVLWLHRQGWQVRVAGKLPAAPATPKAAPCTKPAMCSTTIMLATCQLAATKPAPATKPATALVPTKVVHVCGGAAWAAGWRPWCWAAPVAGPALPKQLRRLYRHYTAASNATANKCGPQILAVRYGRPWGGTNGTRCTKA